MASWRASGGSNETLWKVPSAGAGAEQSRQSSNILITGMDVRVSGAQEHQDTLPCTPGAILVTLPTRSGTLVLEQRAGGSSYH